MIKKTPQTRKTFYQIFLGFFFFGASSTWVSHDGKGDGERRRGERRGSDEPEGDGDLDRFFPLDVKVSGSAPQVILPAGPEGDLVMYVELEIVS